MVSKQQSAAFRRRLIRWYSQYGRDLPWRRTTDPYAILVSEIMLQQTQVSAVVPFYQRWLKRFPTFAALASASESDVLHAWQGLGYYTRARNLHCAAKWVVSQYHGVLPRDPAKIRRLPGLGRYTSSAVATFAFNQPVPIVEANITRVLARLFDISLPVDSSAGRERLWQSAESLLPRTSAGRFNSALMELGALICTKKPRCGLCPVRSFCRARHPGSLPIKAPRPRTVYLIESHAFVRRAGKLLLQKCSDRWRGMWMLPAISTLPGRNQPIYSSVFPFTHHRITLQVFPSQMARSTPDQEWIPIDRLDQIPIPSPQRRALTSLLRTESVI